jgi:hypothetical protein
MTEKITVVCMQLTMPLLMPDNQIGVCCKCGVSVQFRPRAPRGLRICMPCATELFSPNELAVTQHTMDELNEYFRKWRQ